MENYKSFITEQKDEKYKVVVISNELGDKAITAEREWSQKQESLIILPILFLWMEHI